MLVVIIGSQLLKRPCTILFSFIHWLKFLSALEIWGQSGIGHFAFVCWVPYPLKGKQGWRLPCFITKRACKCCYFHANEDTSHPASRAQRPILATASFYWSWSQRYFIDFSPLIFLSVRGNYLQRGENNSQSGEEEKRFPLFLAASRLVPSHAEKNHEKPLGPV